MSGTEKSPLSADPFHGAKRCGVQGKDGTIFGMLILMAEGNWGCIEDE